jgi:hypothetical protein
MMLRLALLGVGLGTYIQADNSSLMAAVPPQQAAAAGGMVSMARGLGTTLGAAVATLTLRASARLDHARSGPAAAMAVLAAAALAATWAGRGGAGRDCGAGRGCGAERGCGAGRGGR